MSKPFTTEMIPALVKRYRPRGWTVQESRHRWTWTSAEANHVRRTIYVPTLNDLDALQLFLHECGHIILKHWDHDQPKHKEEFEAEKFSLGILRNEGISVPKQNVLDAKVRVRGWISHDEARLISIKPHIRRWANAGA